MLGDKPLDADVSEYIKQNRRRNERWEIAGQLAWIIGVLAFLGTVFFVQFNGCKAGDDRVLEAIKSSGLTNPTLGGTDGLACAENESSRHFKATNAQGEHVEGTVCCGLTGVGKGCTIRWGR